MRIKNFNDYILEARRERITRRKVDPKSVMPKLKVKHTEVSVIDTKTENEIPVKIFLGIHYQDRTDERGVFDEDLTDENILNIVKDGLPTLNNRIEFGNYPWDKKNNTDPTFAELLKNKGLKSNPIQLRNQVVFKGLSSNINVPAVIYKSVIDSNRALYEIFIYVKTVMKKEKFRPSNEDIKIDVPNR